MKFTLKLFSVVTLVSSLTFSGCANSESTTDLKETNTPPVGEDHSAHAHPSEGPHHGPLIELGAEDYHAEFLHDEEAGIVTIYVLDSAAKTAVPIEATEITINLKHDGQGEQFKLAAKPLEGEAEGTSSRFVSEDKELGEHLHSETAKATLVITIKEKPFRGKVPHAHNHGHEH